VDCGLWIADCGLRIVDCGLWIADCKKKVSGVGCQVSERKNKKAETLLIGIGDCGSRNANFGFEKA
jgi:hypothetical protein